MFWFPSFFGRTWFTKLWIISYQPYPTHFCFLKWFEFLFRAFIYNFSFLWNQVSAQWKRLPTGNEPPPARAYHSLTCMGSRYLLFGGFDGKSTFGDLWWLVPEGTNMSSYCSHLIICLLSHQPLLKMNWVTLWTISYVTLLPLSFKLSALDHNLKSCEP